MEIPKVLNLYSKDKLRDRKSEDVVQKYMSSFYLHVLEKALGVILKRGSPRETSLCSYKNQGLVLKTILRIAIDF